jgi:hypothetical protein
MNEGQSPSLALSASFSNFIPRRVVFSSARQLASNRFLRVRSNSYLTYTYSLCTLSKIFVIIMPNSEISRDELLEILEATTHAQLKTLRSLRKKSAPPADPDKKKGKSNMEIVQDILLAANGPLHINEIILKARLAFGVQLRRESLVSALTKKVLDQHTFRRTAPNTFDLLPRSPQL